MTLPYLEYITGYIIECKISSLNILFSPTQSHYVKLNKRHTLTIVLVQLQTHAYNRDDKIIFTRTSCIPMSQHHHYLHATQEIDSYVYFTGNVFYGISVRLEFRGSHEFQGFVVGLYCDCTTVQISFEFVYGPHDCKAFAF